MPSVDTTHPYDVSWMEERVDSVPYRNGLYKFCCFMLGRAKKKMTYNDIFVLLYGLHKRKAGSDEAKRLALQEVVGIYEHLNNKLPEMKRLNDK